MDSALDKVMKILPAVLKASGVDFAFNEVPPEIESTVPISQAASLPGAKMIAIRGRLKSGVGFTGIIVANTPNGVAETRLDK